MENVGRGNWIEKYNPTGFVSGTDDAKNTFAG